MRVKIDYDLCMGDGNCSKVCPEVFGYDASALKGIVKLPDVPPAHEKAVRRAADECAPGAIAIEE